MGGVQGNSIPLMHNSQQDAENKDKSIIISSCGLCIFKQQLRHKFCLHPNNLRNKYTIRLFFPPISVSHVFLSIARLTANSFK